MRRAPTFRLLLSSLALPFDIFTGRRASVVRRMRRHVSFAPICLNLRWCGLGMVDTLTVCPLLWGCAGTAAPPMQQPPMQQPAYGAPPGAPYGAPPGAPYGAPPGAPYGAPPQGKHELLHSCVACVTLTFGCSFLASAQASHTVPHHQERTHSKAHRMELPQVSPSAPLYPWLVLCPVDTVESHVNSHSDSGGWWWWM